MEKITYYCFYLNPAARYRSRTLSHHEHFLEDLESPAVVLQHHRPSVDVGRVLGHVEQEEDVEVVRDLEEADGGVGLDARLGVDDHLAVEVQRDEVVDVVSVVTHGRQHVLEQHLLAKGDRLVLRKFPTDFPQATISLFFDGEQYMGERSSCACCSSLYTLNVKGPCAPSTPPGKSKHVPSFSLLGLARGIRVQLAKMNAVVRHGVNFGFALSRHN